MKTKNFSWHDVEKRAEGLANKIRIARKQGISHICLFGVARGGIIAAVLVARELEKLKISSILGMAPNYADYIIDDVIDTGNTRKKYENCKAEFMALVDKEKESKNIWISFPWERMTGDVGPVNNIRRLIEYIGDDPNREGLKATPNRIIRSYEKLYGGYDQEPMDVIKVFEDDNCDEMVVIKNIQFYSTCEHHMLPFFGKAHIAYIPKGRVIGVSKLIRILEIYTRRLSIQERIVQQVTKALEDHLHPRGAACILEAQHFCMTARGVEKQDAIMVTSSLTGSFKESIETRNEFLKMIRR